MKRNTKKSSGDRIKRWRGTAEFDPGRVKTPMREVDTSFLKKRILQFGGASVSVLASLHLRENHLLFSCSAQRVFTRPGPEPDIATVTFGTWA